MAKVLIIRGPAVGASVLQSLCSQLKHQQHEIEIASDLEDAKRKFNSAIESSRPFKVVLCAKRTVRVCKDGVDETVLSTLKEAIEALMQMKGQLGKVRLAILAKVFRPGEYRMIPNEIEPFGQDEYSELKQLCEEAED